MAVHGFLAVPVWCAHHEDGELDGVSSRLRVARLHQALPGHVALRGVAGRRGRAVHLKLAAAGTQLSKPLSKCHGGCFGHKTSHKEPLCIRTGNYPRLHSLACKSCMLDSRAERATAKSEELLLNPDTGMIRAQRRGRTCRRGAGGRGRRRWCGAAPPWRRAWRPSCQTCRC